MMLFISLVIFIPLCSLADLVEYGCDFFTDGLVVKNLLGGV